MTDREQALDRDQLYRLGARQRARIGTVAYIAVLVAIAIWCFRDPDRWQLPNWPAATSNWVVALVGQAGSIAARELLMFLGLGVLMGAACGPIRQRRSRIPFVVGWLVAFAGSLGVGLTVRMLGQGPPVVAPSILAILTLLVTCLWGTWLGVTWMGATSSFRWLLNQTVLAACLGCGALAILLWCVLSTQPLEISSTPVSTEDRRRLVRLFQHHDPRKLQTGETTQLTLSERDLNQLASWGLSLLPQDHQAQFDVDDDKVSLKATLQWSRVNALPGYLNLAASGHLVTRNDQLGFLPAAFEFGRIKIPAWLLRATGPMLIGNQWHSEAVEPFFRSLRSVEMEPHGVRVTYGRLHVREGLLRDTLVNIGVLEDLGPAARDQVTQLVELIERNPNPSFSQCLETAFVEAKRRTAAGDAVRENRAALLALGYVLGHSSLRTFLGPDIPALTNEAQQRFRRVTLRGRQDWTRHYTLSAALQVLSNSSTSIDVGLLKEELDADGGSGFSFADLLADRAGTMLADRATASEAAATVIQNRLAEGVPAEQIIPAGADLPEGLSDRAFQERFGGVGGEGYRRLLEEIDRRLDACVAFTLP